jgi:hypothetical protein
VKSESENEAMDDSDDSHLHREKERTQELDLAQSGIKRK